MIYSQSPKRIKYSPKKREFDQHQWNRQMAMGRKYNDGWGMYASWSLYVSHEQTNTIYHVYSRMQQPTKDQLYDIVYAFLPEDIGEITLMGWDATGHTGLPIQDKIDLKLVYQFTMRCKGDKEEEEPVDKPQTPMWSFYVEYLDTDLVFRIKSPKQVVSKQELGELYESQVPTDFKGITMMGRSVGHSGHCMLFTSEPVDLSNTYDFISYKHPITHWDTKRKRAISM